MIGWIALLLTLPLCMHSATADVPSPCRNVSEAINSELTLIYVCDSQPAYLLPLVWHPVQLTLSCDTKSVSISYT
jgi:hypothetical protein